MFYIFEKAEMIELFGLVLNWIPCNVNLFKLVSLVASMKHINKLGEKEPCK